jgi:hypothetical protein
VLRAGDSVVWAPEGTSVSEGAAAEFVEYKLRGEMAKVFYINIIAIFLLSISHSPSLTHTHTLSLVLPPLSSTL